ncbi:MAG: hypothetical protein JXD19_06670 [Deltaproteobacteria bacterium]|nr:hypothetical protein [Deltaproteobacteria bacterium]
MGARALPERWAKEVMNRKENFYQSGLLTAIIIVIKLLVIVFIQDQEITV